MMRCLWVLAGSISLSILLFIRHHSSKDTDQLDDDKNTSKNQKNKNKNKNKNTNKNQKRKDDASLSSSLTPIHTSDKINDMDNKGNRFAHFTLKSRFPSIVRRIVESNHLQHQHRSRDDAKEDEKQMNEHGDSEGHDAPLHVDDKKRELLRFAEEIERGAPLRALSTFAATRQQDVDSADDNKHDDNGASETMRHGSELVRDWDMFWKREVFDVYRERGWLDLPWFAGETYLYRVLLDLWGYDDPSDMNTFSRDPWRPQKLAELDSTRPWQLVQDAVAWSTSPSDHAPVFTHLLKAALWGNRADLSYDQVSNMQVAHNHSSQQRNPLLLCDDTAAATACLLSDDVRSIGYIADNAGTELLLDLVLIESLLRRRPELRSVTLHVKGRPTYVSDATVDDVVYHIHRLRNYAENPAVAAVGARLLIELNAGRLRLRGDLFWNSCFFFHVLGRDWDLDTPVVSARVDREIQLLSRMLARHDMAIIKGDANYRRLVDDSLDLDSTTSFADHVSAFFPTPRVVALRTLKADPIIGLPPGMATSLDQEDGKWRVNGKRGVIQFSSLV